MLVLNPKPEAGHSLRIHACATIRFYYMHTVGGGIEKKLSLP